MVRWSEFEAASPEIAAAGRRLLGANDLAFLATVSRRGRPRVHPFCPAIAAGHLYAFIIDASPKRRDLDENGRFAIHAWPGANDEQFYVSGRARRIDDPAVHAAALAAMPYDDADEHHLLYEFVLDGAMWTTWEQFQQPGMRPLHRVWRG